MVDMRIRWSGEAVSETRINKHTGEKQRYALTIFEDGQASCSCPAFILNAVNNAKIAPEEKLRSYRCKHLLAAFDKLGGPPAIGQQAPEEKPKRARKEPVKVVPKHDDIALDFDDFRPIGRRD